MSALALALALDRDDFASLAKKFPEPHVQLGSEGRAHVAVGDVIAGLPAHQDCAVVPFETDQFCEERSAPRSLTSVVNDASSVRHENPRLRVRYQTNGTIKRSFPQGLLGEKFARVVAS